MGDPLDRRTADGLRAHLEERGLSWPAPIEHFEALTSTSDRLKELAREGAPEWTAVLADRQTAGRGRQGSLWLSPPGNLFLSVLLRPALDNETAGLVPLAAGAAVCEALRSFGASATVKWPNDVLVGERKIAGVLSEANWVEGVLDAVFLGIGVNLALDPRDLPPALRPRTTSLVAETSHAADRDAVAAEVLARLRVWYHALRGGGAAIVEGWRALSSSWWGRRIEVRSGGATIEGLAYGVDGSGALLLQLDDGEVVRVLAGEARRLRLG
jgi:BirA family biotin operon repressor/biotin-[acetyl-CoA-carboxylase] ligase